MHPAIGYALAQARAADLRHQAQRQARARAARRARRTSASLNMNDAQHQVLFATTSQRSDAPGAEMVAEAIAATMARFGADGCTGRMAQESGDHPEAAAARMRWVRSLLSFR